MDNCKHYFRGVSYGNGPILECKYCGQQKPFAQDLDERIKQQRSHYLYTRSGELHDKYREQQLIKGAETYPEPLEPDSWTAAEAAGHAFQELIDLEQYVTMQLIKNERLEVNIKELEQENKELKQQLKEQSAAALRAIRKAYCYGR